MMKKLHDLLLFKLKQSFVKSFLFLFLSFSFLFSLSGQAQTSGTLPCNISTLSNNNGYYGGFEAGGVKGINNFIKDAAGNDAAFTEYAEGSKQKEYQILANTIGQSGYLPLLPHSGGFFLATHISANPLQKLWYKTFTVSAGQQFQVCAWIANLKENPLIGFPVVIKVNAGLVSTVIATKSPVTNAWVRFCGTYTVPVGVSSIEVEINDPTPAINGSSHFLGLDDICITEIPQLNLGNSVWFDANNDGIKQTTETGIAGATVNLYIDANNDNIPDGTSVATTTTDGSGNYSFSNLISTKYIVGVVIPTGYIASSVSSSNPDDNVDNDNNGVTIAGTEVRSNAITLLVGTEPLIDGDGANGNLTLDFGLTKTGSIGDRVFNDANGDGLQTIGEVGISGVKVTLTNTTNNATVSVNTDVNGNYTFGNLTPGTYTVMFTTPTNFTATAPNVGTDDTKDSDPVGGVVTVTVVAGVANTSVDAGFYQTLNLGNTVFYDANNDGIKQTTEIGLSGITVKLYAAGTTTSIGTTTTDANGVYSFTGLTPGNYFVGVTTPSGYAQGTLGSTTPNDNIDNDNNGVTTVGTEVRSNAITLVSGTEPTTDGDGANGNLTLDFGLRGTGSIGDFVFNDANGNGLQDVGEVGVAGVVITLKDAANNIVGSVTTTSTGAYTFSNLAPGSYTVMFTTPTGFTATIANAGDDAKDSDPIGGSVSVTVTGVANTTVDAGFYQAGSIGDRVFDDANRNGLQDAGEVGIQNVAVTLTNITSNATVLANTDANGNYTFGNLAPGMYTVTFTTPTGFTATAAKVGGDDTKDSDPVGGVVTVTVVAGVANTSVDAGFYQTTGISQTTSIGNTVFFDANNDGIKQTTEVGLSGLTVNLYTGAGVFVTTTTTGTNGLYSFTGLTPGDYIVGVVLPIGYAQGTTTTSSATPNNNIDDDNNGVTTVVSNGVSEVRSNAISIALGNTNSTLDFGLRATGSIGDFVFNDVNANGIQDDGGAGIAGVVVTLKDAANNIVATFTTLANGAYSFNNVAPGTYTVTFTTPTGFTPTTANVGDDTKDSDPINGAVSVTVTGAANTSIDAGFYLVNTTGSISGNVFDDKDGLTDNNINQSAGVANPTTNVGGQLFANLLNAAGNVVASVPVGNNGAYLFDAVPLGAYSVQLTTNTNSGTFASPATAPATALPNGWVNTGEFNGNTAGSDGVVNGISANVILASANDIKSDINFGIDQLSTAVNRTLFPGSRPALNSIITLNTVILRGSDPEDQPTEAVLTGKSIKITALPTNSLLLYNGIPVTTNQVIANFNPDLLQIKFTDANLGSRTQFSYAYVDAAGFSGIPATYAVLFPDGAALPVTLTEFTATKNNCTAILIWKTSSEINTDRFDVQVSKNGSADFKTVGTRAASSNSSTLKTYQFDYAMEQGAVHYFRLKMFDKDGTFTYSIIRQLSCVDVKREIIIAPNPVVDIFKISGLSKGKNTISLFSTDGKLLKSQISSGTIVPVDISNLPKGLYIVRILNEDGSVSTAKVIKN